MQIKDVVTQNEEGFNLHIALNEMFAGVKVTSISMFIANDDDSDGDLAVNWEADTLENTGGGNMGTLLMRGDEDEVGAVMGEFYWERGFDKRLKEILIAHGFSAKAAADVRGSEWGMQDEERASYDAYELASEVRETFGVVVEA